ncbi:MAG: lysophospholipid acyltransferase family protein [Terracidiphilus sp.]
MTLRRVWRAVALVIVLAWIVWHFWWMRLCGRMTLVRRAAWLLDASQRVLRCLGVEVKVEGTPPTSGLVVSNHLSYLDILILSAAMPCFFVSKKEVENWPYFGWAARTGGTLFLDRKSKRSAMRITDEIAERLNLPVPVLLFPEGTSTDGSHVLRFHSGLIDPATKAGAPITAVAIRYAAAGGTEERELCWYGGAEFLPHTWKVMGVQGFTAQLRFGEPRIYTDRRVAAERTHAEIEEWREANAPVTQYSITQ